ncbi:aminotransferase class V-fold PLP-dependent enzyme [Rhodoplanes sp. TEM]|uniref:Aminotransferase class V-fold PLP-dependent enzyme n=1 Tax=Rhodoplanes tepidamans TaxID=200616 RepID=A0ABT5J762_RHOTP|nr:MULTISPECIES: aminotransferase class V-fold PLP-dependent enzyme [Rhodoplanes]MDC7785441.1 aminotransferase class V-fold PLP-dependent enzyme [Rhodoplanes tepidamans]MDC7985778.1 aminotransferase class V-fold PLP-dependent enzyme [Rhodoplanes sp. TEM]MDQ0353105.1 L-2,4-diaminobutyrate decarboxylase [Rhodoplanes tepidamans]
MGIDDRFRDDAAIAVDALAGFAAQSAGRAGPVIRQPALGDLACILALDRLIAEGGLTGDRLRAFLADYLAASTRLHHPGYMAHQVAVPQPLSAVAALVDGFCNNAMAIYEMGPAAATVEFAVIAWMLRKIGWRAAPPTNAQAPEAGTAGGVLTHGGSLANLTALLAARGRVAPRAWENGTPDNLVIVASPAAHYSVARAAGLLGLGQKAVRAAPADAAGRLDPDRLAGCLDRLRDDGLVPMAVVANACATALGLYDPLRPIAETCRARGIWLHVDGAHGASALVSQRLRRKLDGIALADSVVWDAHKMLGSATLCAAVLVRDRADLDHAFREEASYLFHDKDQPGIDLIHRTVECTKAAIGLKAFFALAAGGESAVAAMVERQTDLAAAAAARLRAEPGFEVAVEPESNIVCFRLDGPDALQMTLRRRLVDDGAFYVSTAEALGRRWLRLALMNPATGMPDVEALIARLSAIRAEVRAEFP